MAAATADTTTSRVRDWTSAVFRYLYPFMEEGMAVGVMVPVNDKITIPTTSIDDVGDITRLSQLFPAHSYVHAFRGTPSDMDTNGAPALVYDIIAVDQDGNTLSTLVSGSTKGQAGVAADVLADLKQGSYVGAKEWFLALKTTTAAATAAAGTYAWSLVISQGTMHAVHVGSGPYLANAEA